MSKSVTVWSESFGDEESLPYHELVAIVANRVPPERYNTVLLNFADDSNGKTELYITYDKD